MSVTEVILTEKIEGLGAEADVVKVKCGYARNFLLPAGKAYEATKGNLLRLETLRQKRAEREATEVKVAEKIASRVRKLKITLDLATGETGKAFGSITTQDIHAAIVAELGEDTAVDRHQIELEKPIKKTGAFAIPIKLHSEVRAELKLTVRSSNQPEEGGDADAEPAARADAAE